MRKIGLFGFGCVAQGFFEALADSPIDNAQVKKICIKDKNKSRGIDPALFTDNPNDILEDSEIDIIIELIDDADAALGIVMAALNKGIPTISANKKMVAEHLEKLVTLQKTTGTPFRYEGAVCGSIPILENLENYYSSQRILQIRGILNGSTNYILTKMKSEGISFASALEQAKSLGYAESNPTLDVQGYDPMYKAIILAYHAFGIFIAPSDVARSGIDALTPLQQQQGRREYNKIKLVATLLFEEDQLQVKVAPEVINVNDPLYSIDYEFNAVEVHGAFSGKQLLVGKGAGSHPTGSAVLSDLNIILKSSIEVMN